MQKQFYDNAEVSNFINPDLINPDLIKKGFSKIAPFWPLKNLIYVNPLQGLEDLPVSEALKTGNTYFQKHDIPPSLEAINIQTIKWLQVFFDEGQSKIPMPFKKEGLYTAWGKLAPHDNKLHLNNANNKSFLQTLPQNPMEAINNCLIKLGISKEETDQFITLLLTTLPGWSSYIKYLSEWQGKWSGEDSKTTWQTSIDYVAVRLIITTLLWPKAKELLEWHKDSIKESDLKGSQQLTVIKQAEHFYRAQLLDSLAKSFKKQNVPHEKPQVTNKTKDAALVFCIDTRSEQIRKRLEEVGNYETFSSAGFFGILAKIENKITKNYYNSCPALLTPSHTFTEGPCSHHERDLLGHTLQITLKKLYQSIKYTLVAPFAMVETLGPLAGIWMGFKTFTPKLALRLKNLASNAIRPSVESAISLEGIPLEDQYAYAKNALTMIGMAGGKYQFPPIVVFCGHGSTTQNNAYASALQCGACGGNGGSGNAKILVAILNNEQVRDYLTREGIIISKETMFVAAGHDTTTGEVALFGVNNEPLLNKLKSDLLKVYDANNLRKNRAMNNSQDWAQVRPEWGLAQNAAFIAAPRNLTSSIDLKGRCFLHSYDYKQDKDGEILTKILTAPMAVAQWINSQYLFSTLDNAAYGGGSKVTKNITGKFAVMQGNASDLMCGLPLQSVYKSDKEAYHQPQRLLTVVLAPRFAIDKVVKEKKILQKLFYNGWVQLAAIEPEDGEVYLFNNSTNGNWDKQDSSTALKDHLLRAA